MTNKAKKNDSWSQINLHPIDNILHKTDDDSRQIVEVFGNQGVNYLQALDSFPNEKTGACFYKYMDLESALLCLKNKNIRFVEPTRWEDKYEGRFYKANYDNVSNNEHDSPLLYACCLTHKPNNEAAWKLYSYGKTGLGAHCVQFKINRLKFRSQLAKASQVKAGYTVFEGKVSYYSQTIINGIHKKNYKSKSKGLVENKNYHLFFDHFTLLHYLNLLLLKRDYFIHEHEVRFFIIPNDESKPKGKVHQKDGIKTYGDAYYVDIDWFDIIEEIKIDSKCGDVEYDIFKDACLSLIPDSYKKKPLNEEEKSRLNELVVKLTPKREILYGKRQTVTIDKA